MCLKLIPGVFHVLMCCLFFSFRSQGALWDKRAAVWQETWLCPGWCCPACRPWPPQALSLHPHPPQAARSTNGQLPHRRAACPAPNAHASTNICRWAFVLQLMIIFIIDFNWWIVFPINPLVFKTPETVKTVPNFLKLKVTSTNPKIL